MQIFNKFTNFILTGAYFLLFKQFIFLLQLHQQHQLNDKNENDMPQKNNKSHIVPFFSYKKIYHLFVSIFCLYQNVDMFGCHNDWNKIEISSGK